MLINRLNLPIHSERLAQLDQTLSLSNMSWDDYEQLVKENTGFRISYFNGVITIVSPSQSHEVIERVISILINAYCRKYKLLYFPMGSTTLKNPFTVGKEPDTSYAFNTAKDTPDLAVEVVFSSGSVNDLQKYKYLGVKEVWFWQDNEIKFYELLDSEYVKIDVSSCLSQLSAEFLIEFINRGLTESPLIIEADFCDRLE